MNAFSPASPQPAHVPDAAVYDFDLFHDPALLTDPHERVRELLRDAPPVFWTPRNGGHWMFVGHEENHLASRETETFSSELYPREMMDGMRAAMSAQLGHVPLPTPINLDPPDHTKYRKPLLAAFSPKAMAARREDVRELANSLIDAVIGQGHCDFIPDIAEPLPVQVFLTMMGLPIERAAEFRRLVHEFMAPSTDPLDGIYRMRNVADAMKDEIKARRTDPRDDLISLLWQSDIEGEPMTFELMEDYAVLLFIAGLDTVINGMGFGVRHLAQNPDLQDLLRADPSRIRDTMEELLRRYTFTVPTRRVTKDIEFAGWQMKANDRLMLFLPGADLDERAFPAPEVFNLDRESKVHIAFGVGPHRCLGSHLARLELQVIYEQLLAKLPAFRLDPDKPVKFHSGNIIAVDSLPLRWD